MAKQAYQRRISIHMSYAPEVIADNSGKFYGNSLRFATREEAKASVEDLESRWMLVRETRVVESEDPVNFAWVNGELVDALDPAKAKA